MYSCIRESLIHTVNKSDIKNIRCMLTGFKTYHIDLTIVMNLFKYQCPFDVNKIPTFKFQIPCCWDSSE